MQFVDLTEEPNAECHVSPFPEVAESVQQELESYRAQEDEVKRLKSIMVSFITYMCFMQSITGLVEMLSPFCHHTHKTCQDILNFRHNTILKIEEVQCLAFIGITHIASIITVKRDPDFNAIVRK